MDVLIMLLGIFTFLSIVCILEMRRKSKGDL